MSPEEEAEIVAQANDFAEACKRFNLSELDDWICSVPLTVEEACAIRAFMDERAQARRKAREEPGAPP